MLARLPLWVRKALTDFVTSAVAAFSGINVLAIFASVYTMLPDGSVAIHAPSVDQFKVLGIAVAVAVISAFVSAARRATPDAIVWAKAQWTKLVCPTA